MKITLDNTTIDLTPSGKSYRAVIGDDAYDVEIIHVDTEHGRLDLRVVRLPDSQSVSIRESVTESVDDIRLSASQSVGESVFTAYVSTDGTKRWVTINGQTFVLTKSSGARKSGGGHHHAAGELTAPMPGQVRAVNVSEGDAVTKGQTLIVLEAMKMEIRIQASIDGMVVKLLVEQGQTVEREQTLIEIEDN